MDVSSAFILVAFLLGLLLLGVPVGFSLGLASILTISLVGWDFLMLVPLTLGRSFSDFVLLAIPLFILMGEILHRGGVGHNLFDLAHKWLLRVKGGTGISAVFAFTIFAAIVGSSMASVLTIGKIAIPEMEAQGYPKRINYGLTVVGGSLGILIPPSIPLLLYAALTDTSPSKLFAAGLLPGLLIAAALALWALLSAPAIPVTHRFSLRNAIAVTLRGIPDLLLPVIVLYGIFAGWYTPTEAAAIGTIYALLLTVVIRRTLRLRDLPSVFFDSLRTSVALLAIVLGAMLFGAALTLLGLPQFFSTLIANSNISPLMLLLVFFVIWLVMGAFLEVASIILITVPVFFPIAYAAGIDPIWFGIFMVLNMEIAVITPPVGMNLFALKSILPNVSLGLIARSAFPSIALLLGGLAALVIFPQLTNVLN